MRWLCGVQAAVLSFSATHRSRARPLSWRTSTMLIPAAETDTRQLAELLAGTVDPAQREAAEQQLSALQEVIGFAPALMRVLVYPEASASVRQSAAVYLKNLVASSWRELETEPGEQAPFALPECDRVLVRDALVEATVRAPEPVRVQLCVCVKHIIKHDFPARWTRVVDEILAHLQGADTSTWYGASLCLYQLIKSYEYQTNDKRAPFVEAMRHLLPAMQQLMERLMPDESEQAALLKKQLVKNFFGLVKYTLPLELISKETFSQWMEVLRRLVDASIPPQTLEVDADERLELPWWKSKKWAVRTLCRLFERYGSPVSAREEYVEFAEWYLTTFTGGILEVLFKVLASYRSGEYVSPRVLQHTLCYIDQCVSHAHSWNFLKAQMFGIVQDILFPLMSHSLEDEELWKTDPVEYIRIKYDIFEDFVSPVTAGKTLLINCCKKRKEMLQRTMQLCMQVLTAQNGEYGPRQRDGALHMVGTLSDILMKKKLYKEQMDRLLTQYVFPEFNNPLGYLRARACWVLHYFSTVPFHDQGVLMEAVRLTVNALLTDTDLPVKVEAAIAMQMLLASQHIVQKYLEPQITTITLELLNIIRETENDDLTSVMQRIVPLYTAQLMPMAVEICEHLASTFSSVLESGDGTDEKAITAMGLLNTIETIITVMEDNKEIMAELEKTVLRVVGHIFQQAVSEYYEEALSLMYELSSSRVSEDMWKMLELLYQVFEKDGFDYFTDMMPVLHNYVTVDTDAFVSNENHILAIFNMCKKVLNADDEEEPGIYAAKLLEVMVLQCKDRINQCLPSFVELVLSRLTRKVKTSELRTMALQVLIAILYCNPLLLFNIIEKLQESLPNTSIAQHFIKQWIHDADCFLGLHDRKICVLGLCTLLEMGPARPPVLDEVVGKIVPSCLVLFDGLKRAYEARAEGSDDESSSEEEDDEDEVLSSDEDEIEYTNNTYLENLSKAAAKNGSGDNKPGQTIEDYESDDDDDDEYESDEAGMDGYTTPLDKKDCDVDEYVCFKGVLTGLAATEPALYHALTGALNENQQKALQEVFLLADQRRAQHESKRIEQSGGYSFTVPAAVPTTFKFGS